MRVHPVSRHHRGAPWLFLKRAAVRNWRLHTFYHKLLQLLPHSPSEIWIDIIKNCSNGSIQQEKYTGWRFTSSELFKGTGHFFETLSLASVPGTDHSQIYAFMINNSFQTEKCIYMPVSAQFFLPAYVNQKSVNLGIISARHTSNRQSFKKVTCPFKRFHSYHGIYNAEFLLCFAILFIICNYLLLYIN